MGRTEGDGGAEGRGWGGGAVCASTRANGGVPVVPPIFRPAETPAPRWVGHRPVLFPSLPADYPQPSPLVGPPTPPVVYGQWSHRLPPRRSPCSGWGGGVCGCRRLVGGGGAPAGYPRMVAAPAPPPPPPPHAPGTGDRWHVRGGPPRSAGGGWHPLRGKVAGGSPPPACRPCGWWSTASSQTAAPSFSSPRRRLASATGVFLSMPPWVLSLELMRAVRGASGRVGSRARSWCERHGERRAALPPAT